jgi:phage terminase small subunit
VRKALTAKEKAFCEAYSVNGGNGTQAARTAGYGGDENALAAAASRLLRGVKVQEELATLSRSAIKKAERKTESAVADLAESLAKASEVLRANVVAQAIKEDGSVDIEVLRNAPPGVLKRYKTKSRMERDPDDPTKWTRVEEVAFEAESVMAAAQLLTRHYDAAKDRDAQPAPQVNVLIQNLSIDELRTLKAIAVKALPEGAE